MSRSTPSPRELDILKILWEIGPASVREVHERMSAQAPLAFNTVQTLLRIMDEKGLVVHRVRGRTFVYSARHRRDREMSRLLNHVFDGALDQFVVSLLKTSDASPSELKAMEKLIAEARRKREGRKRPGD
ncbi:MAG TPA: BlaI/MecI/CopY family transcriptional regulator [Pirellulales bacterium]|nr:BlaI/MecI/CopY family transcriptional regulator [Pirellulales bacterium]